MEQYTWIINKGRFITFLTRTKCSIVPRMYSSLFVLKSLNSKMHRKFWTNVWKFLREPIADTFGPEKKRMDTTENSRKNSLIELVLEL